MPAITSRRHPIAARFREAARGDTSTALIDGWHLLHEAFAAGLAIELVAMVDGEHDRQDIELLETLRQARAEVVTVSSSVMDVLSPVRAPTGVVSLVARREGGSEAITEGEAPLVVVAIDVQDPGNTGAIIRAADAGGATGVVCAGITADPWGWKALRAGMGSTFRMALYRTPDRVAACQRLRSRGVRLIASAPEAPTPMHEVDFRSASAILLGGEGEGLAPEILRLADARISIPMRAPVESLNVAVAAGILVYEARRQRTA